MTGVQTCALPISEGEGDDEDGPGAMSEPVQAVAAAAAPSTGPLSARTSWRDPVSVFFDTAPPTAPQAPRTPSALPSTPTMALSARSMQDEVLLASMNLSVFFSPSAEVSARERKPGAAAVATVDPIALQVEVGKPRESVLQVSSSSSSSSSRAHALSQLPDADHIYGVPSKRSGDV